MNSWLNKRVKTVALLLALALLLMGSIVAVQAQSEAPAAANVAGELLVFDWNKPVTTAQHGFPWDKPPKENGNWVSPINYAGGNIYFRAQVISMPKPKSMKLQFCFWQSKNTRETCSRTQAIAPGQVVTWSQPLTGMWKKDNRQLDWTKPRDRNGVAIKTMQGKPVSNYSGWNWNGENPSDWYPMNMRFTVVVVRQGQAFSGWDNYIH
ncbi:MAG: hypothetical protein K1X50_21475 [Candidatus Promineofilum sp.]|nr:hypothetical protein [Promineifilum sp.]MCW5865111.1 hypothetical protein [Anaerolineae bacterium]